MFEDFAEIRVSEIAVAGPFCLQKKKKKSPHLGVGQGLQLGQVLREQSPAGLEALGVRRRAVGVELVLAAPLARDPRELHAGVPEGWHGPANSNWWSRLEQKSNVTASR